MCIMPIGRTLKRIDRFLHQDEHVERVLVVA
jgi:hypothetical protein